MRTFVIAGLALWLTASADARPARKGKPPAAEPAACQKDEDCALVTDGCCGCHEGGKQRAIPVKAREAYEKKRKALCKETACPALMSEDPTCEKRAVCKEGACTLGS
jgi:hypothetical protein